VLEKGLLLVYVHSEQPSGSLGSLSIDYEKVPAGYEYKAFPGSFGRRVKLFNFSMSRVYDIIRFITDDDLLTIFGGDELSHKPKEEELDGVWEGMLVSRLEVAILISSYNGV
jgi:hypothetical protein